LRLTIAVAISLVMTFLLWRALHNPIADNRFEEIYSKVLGWLNFPGVLLGIMTGGVHNADPVVICIGSALQWFGLGYFLSLLFTAPKPSEKQRPVC